ncbi:hypothetical protein D9M69_651600 [compost metagenome]
MALDQRLLLLAIRAAAQLAQLIERVQVAAFLGGRERQHHVFPHPRTHGPDGQIFRVLHGEHGDRQRGRGAFDLQQQVEPQRVRAVEVHAEHVRLLRVGLHGQDGVLRQPAIAACTEVPDQLFNRSVMG